MTPICFIDTETTGVHPGRKVWEVAMILRDDAGQREISFFVEVELVGADPFGLSVGRFYERHPFGRYLAGLDTEEPAAAYFATGRDAGDLAYVSTLAAARLVARWTNGAHLVGIVPNFDSEVLADLLRWHQLIPAWHYHLIDVEAMAVGWLNARRQHGEDPIAPPWRSDDLFRLCGIEPPSDDERHTAMGDTVWAMRIYDRLTSVEDS